QVIVSFLIGNNDMHLKNFSLIAFEKNQYQLAPAYDMVAVKLLIPDDQEELALNLNGKKRTLKRKDFNDAMDKAHIPKKGIENLWNKIERSKQNWQEIIKNSFLKSESKLEMLKIIKIRSENLNLSFKIKNE